MKSASIGKYPGLVEPMEKGVMSLTLELLDWAPGTNAKFLDIGCQDGTRSVRFASKIGSNLIYGIDTDKSMVKTLRQKGIYVLRYDMNKPVSSFINYFDVIHSSHLIEHLYNTDTFIDNIRTMLKKGGYAVIVTPNASAWHNIFPLVFGYQPASSNISNHRHFGNMFFNGGFNDGEYIRHLRLFTLRGITEMLRYYRFTIEYARTYGYPFLPKFINDCLVHVPSCHGSYIVIKVRKQ
jgi:SAM-dependent methyltransferase